MKTLNILDAPLKIYGLAVSEPGKFWRLPDHIINAVKGVSGLGKTTTGGCVRFRTDSPTVYVKVNLLNTHGMNHMPLSGQSGADVYFDKMYAATFRPDTIGVEKYEGTAALPPQLERGVLHDVQINMPLYNGITDMTIGVEDGSAIESPTPYEVEEPMLFYGSSITQGGCASKPGNAYCSMLSRWLDTSHINLGFSGSAKGEEPLAEYIASLDLSAFVCDYDHNAPDAEHLDATHEKFFKIIRDKKPNLPVVFISLPDFDRNPATYSKRRNIIFRTYSRAVKAGDLNVYFVDGETLFGAHDRGACTVDGCHPNDLGFYRMAEGMQPVLREILFKRGNDK